MEEIIIICPWCQSATSVYDYEDELRCSSCRRIITENDLEDATVKEGD